MTGITMMVSSRGSFELEMWQWLLFLGALLVTALATAYMNSTFSRYEKVFAASGLTGAEAAEKILYSRGLGSMPITCIAGRLTDHYDPSRKSLGLSESTYHRSSVAAIAVAAHECGHAGQDDTGYVMLSLKTALVPVTNLASQLAFPIIVLGIIFSLPVLAQAGVYLFAAVVVFQLVTLPVEFNASRRGLQMMTELKLVNGEELAMSRRVLTAAALTYVAALASTLMTLLRLLLITRRRSD